MTEKTCRECLKKFTSERKNGSHCSQECAVMFNKKQSKSRSNTAETKTYDKVRNAKKKELYRRYFAEKNKDESFKEFQERISHE